MRMNSDVTVLPPMERHGLIFPFGQPGRQMAPLDIAEGVRWFQIPLGSASGMGVINTWALRDGDGWAVVDVGMDAPACVARWEELTAPNGALGGAPTRIIATHMHGDHIGYAGPLNRRHGCPLWMTRGDYLQAKQIIEDYARGVPADHLQFFRAAGWSQEMLDRHQPFGKSMAALPDQYRRIRDGDTIEVGKRRWQVITTSGHSPEHACLFDAEGLLLIAGDQLLPDVSSNVSVMPVEPWANPMQDWLSSLHKLASMFDDEVLVLPAHGAPFKGVPKRAKQLADKRYRALDRLRAQLRAHGPQRALDVYPALFNVGALATPFQQTLATGEAMAYLNYLLAEGEIVMQADAAGVNWYTLA